MTKEDYILRYIQDKDELIWTIYWYVRSFREELLEAILDIGDPNLAASYAWALELNNEDFPELTKLIHSSKSPYAANKKHLTLWKLAFCVLRERSWDPKEDLIERIK